MRRKDDSRQVLGGIVRGQIERQAMTFRFGCLLVGRIGRSIELENGLPREVPTGDVGEEDHGAGLAAAQLPGEIDLLADTPLVLYDRSQRRVGPPARKVQGALSRRFRPFAKLARLSHSTIHRVVQRIRGL